jgi:uncharacterized protein
MGPLLTIEVHEALLAAGRSGSAGIECSLDLQRTQSRVEVAPDHWSWQGSRFPYLAAAKERTIYYWTGAAFEPAARYSNALIKLIPTQWGAPTFEIDGIKMLPTSRESPYTDAERKVRLIRPPGRHILDTCGGLGYFASWCQQLGAAAIQSYEKNPDVIWLRGLNPWSPQESGGLTVSQTDVTQAIHSLEDRSSMRCYTILRVSGSRASCTRRSSMLSLPESSNLVGFCSITPERPTG